MAGKETSSNVKSNVLWRIVKLLIACYVITGAFLALLAFIIYKTSPSAQFVSGAILFSYVLSTFIGGLILGKIMGKKKYLWGILFGLLYFIIVFAISLAMNQVVGEPFKDALTICMLCVSGGMLGGMIG